MTRRALRGADTRGPRSRSKACKACGHTQLSLTVDEHTGLEWLARVARVAMEALLAHTHRAAERMWTGVKAGSREEGGMVRRWSRRVHDQSISNPLAIT